MNRLTREDTKFNGYTHEEVITSDLDSGECLTKLAAYEDTGLTPEELQEFLKRIDLKDLHDHISELLELEKQGLLIKLPYRNKSIMTTYVGGAINWLRKEKNFRESHEPTDYIDLAISALEKQIPKQVNEITIIMQYKAVLDGYCPSCERYITNSMNYCTDCGQCLDWEEESDE